MESVSLHLVLSFILFSMGFSAPTPTMESTGLLCRTTTSDASMCQPKRMIFKFELEGCEKADYKCLNVCSGLCSSSNLVQKEAPYRELSCPKCVPRRTYNTATLKLRFKCKGVTVHKTLEHRKIKRCACKWYL